MCHGHGQDVGRGLRTRALAAGIPGGTHTSQDDMRDQEDIYGPMPRSYGYSQVWRHELELNQRHTSPVSAQCSLACAVRGEANEFGWGGRTSLHGWRPHCNTCGLALPTTSGWGLRMSTQTSTTGFRTAVPGQREKCGRLVKKPPVGT